MKEKHKKHGILKGKTEEEEETTKKREPEKGFKKGFGRKKEENVSLKLQDAVSCVIDSKTRFENTRIPGCWEGQHHHEIQHIASLNLQQ